ncbi:hypothetical protein AVEN_120679-1 [Araneus ventricosus]|uniref:Uncharacterized protein n=1 Tax=Araneus ventricosus TaxID=182803 RepID=A0A4Y2LY36_ARAVE|nr:hypothetical protein AVEN_120679-1 [Araneus ventricosus]
MQRRKPAWASEAWRRKVWVETARISASESRNYGLASLCDEKRQIDDLNNFFGLIETKIEKGSTINVRRPHTNFYLSKPQSLRFIMFRSMRLYRPTDSQPFDGFGQNSGTDPHS